MKFLFIVCVALLVATPAAQATGPERPSKREVAQVIKKIPAPKVARCKSAMVGAVYYRLRHDSWRELAGVKMRTVLSPPKGCAHAKWRVELWKSRASEARQAYFEWREEQRRRTLIDYKVVPGNSAWLRAIEQAQKPYPGTRDWLRSCSAPRSEGGWGRWVPNTQGSGAGGWLQFMEGTFWRMFGAALPEVQAMGYIVPRSAASWYSPLGQALAGAWAVKNGATHEWSGSGC